MPMSMEKQVLIIYAGVNGFVDDLPVESLAAFESELFDSLERKETTVLDKIAMTKALTDEIVKEVEATLIDFKKTFIQRHKIETAKAS